ncbi:dienelactone hydrolase family protein [Paractinoplanes maris]|uniref:dienelactone hydrolase family protein n=1 Tax=Paractinoplanes maris TaxID=1734446 RepID=UPI0020209F2A|nr:alpha/beta fold hydrolase [Actinoplanes maris]
MDRIRRWSLPLLALILAVTGSVLLARAGDGLERRHVVVGGVPLDVVRPAGSPPGPGVVVAHGYAGSARLMAQFGDTLAARGFTVVLPDLDGHGANTRSPVDLRNDLDVAVAHLRGLPGVDSRRIALVGHSMGAGAVTEYAVDHPEIAATVAISLPGASPLPPDRPDRLLLLVGGLEFAGFREAAEEAVAGARVERSMVIVPGVEHISILYAPRTHRLTADWLSDADGPLPSPVRRLTAAGLLLLGLLVGFPVVAGLLLRSPVTAPLTIAYAAAAIAVPLHLGFTHAVPAGSRWWLLLAMWAAFAVLAFVAGLAPGGTLAADLIVAVVTVVALTAAAVSGLAPGFILLVVPLLGVLMVIQAGLAAVLRARSAPPWLIALTGSLLVAWPIATTLPVL